MNYIKYEAFRNSDATIYYFVSSGNIQQAVIFTQTKNPDIYNLGFGNLLFSEELNNYVVDDVAVNNNGDIREILATVAQTAYEFSSRYPERKIFFRGSDLRRTNTYKRAIALNYNELSETFDIFGALFDDTENVVNIDFDYKRDFDGFLFKRK